jgi:hypothetical protein
MPDLLPKPLMPIKMRALARIGGCADGFVALTQINGGGGDASYECPQ